MAELTYLQAISDGLRTEMRRDKRVFIIGEDVGVYGGAFKVTLGFQEEFGPWPAHQSPPSETCIPSAPRRAQRPSPGPLPSSERLKNGPIHGLNPLEPTCPV